MKKHLVSITLTVETDYQQLKQFFADLVNDFNGEKFQVDSESVKVTVKEDDNQPCVPLGYSSFNPKTGEMTIRTKI